MYTVKHQTNGAEKIVDSDYEFIDKASAKAAVRDTANNFADSVAADEVHHLTCGLSAVVHADKLTTFFWSGDE